jgi:hypothetical protein
MSQHIGPVDRFIGSVRRRLNLHRLGTTLVWTVVAAALALVVVGLWYTLRGHAVPQVAISVVLIAAVVGGCVAWIVRWISADGAAGFADRFYRLHDGISSYLHFRRQGRSGGYYALQASQIQGRVEELNPRTIRYQAPKRGILLGACLLAVAVPLSQLGPSAEVVQQQLLAEETQEATTIINEELEKLVEKLAEEVVDPNEEELLNPNQLRQFVDQLEDTSDQQDALRQYARLERQLNEARLAVQSKEQEQLLARAAEQLEESRETARLAEQLQQKDYPGAAEELQKMEPQATQPLDQQRKDLARLKSAAQRMAAAARAMKSANNPSDSPNASASPSTSASAQAAAGRNGAGGSGSAGAGGGGGKEMADTMESLDQAVANLDKALQEALRQHAQLGQTSDQQAGECQECQMAVSNQLNQLSNQLNRLGMMRNVDRQLSQLCSMCSQCQGGLAQMAAMCQSPNPGGQDPGVGSNSFRRSEKDAVVDNGNTSQLKGIQGEGPSQTSIESADEGSGVSTRRATARQVDFKRQFESFVQREDVPEQVKEGVKQYFQIIHAASESTPPSKENVTNERDGN